MPPRESTIAKIANFEHLIRLKSFLIESVFKIKICKSQNNF